VHRGKRPRSALHLFQPSRHGKPVRTKRSEKDTAEAFDKAMPKLILHAFE
jgi:hypothetical protein